MIAKRSLPEIQSIAATATRIIRIRNDTFCHSSTRIFSASCKPIPPAPTMPMMVAERVFEFDEIEHLAGDDRQHLRHQAEADFMQGAAAGSSDTFDLLLVGALDRLGEQFAERAEIRHGNREHARERAEAYDIDPDQRPDQRVDAADRVQETAYRKPDDIRHDVARREQADRQRHQRGDRGAKQRDRQRLAERLQIKRQGGARIGRQHQKRDPAELVQAVEEARRREVEVDQAEDKDGESQQRHERRREARRGRPVEHLRIACAQLGRIGRRDLVHVRASLPNRRLRSQPVPISMMKTVMMIVTRIALTSE